MAYVKWFIYPPGKETPIALKYDYELQAGYIGGSPIDYQTICNIITDFFGIKLGRKKVVSNRIKFKLIVKTKKFENTLIKLDDKGYIVNHVLSHERVMR